MKITNATPFVTVQSVDRQLVSMPAKVAAGIDAAKLSSRDLISNVPGAFYVYVKN